MNRLEEIKERVERYKGAVILNDTPLGSAASTEDAAYLLERIEHLEREIEEKDNYIADLEDEIENKV